VSHPHPQSPPTVVHARCVQQGEGVRACWHRKLLKGTRALHKSTLPPCSRCQAQGRGVWPQVAAAGGRISPQERHLDRPEREVGPQPQGQLSAGGYARLLASRKLLEMYQVLDLVCVACLVCALDCTSLAQTKSPARVLCFPQAVQRVYRVARIAVLEGLKDPNIHSWDQLQQRVAAAAATT